MRNTQSSRCAGSYRFLIAASLAGLLAPGSSAFAADSSSRYPLAVKDGYFSPETVEVRAGEKFRLVVRNEGAEAEEFESHELNREKIIAPGKTVEIIIGPLAAGSYRFFGEFHPETAKGQIVAK